MQNNELATEYNNLDLAYEIASKVIKERIKKGLTQKQLAELVGTSQSAIARIESFEYGKLTITTLQKIGNALQLDLKIEFLAKVS